MPRAINRFRELVASAGLRTALARTTSRLFEVSGQRLQTASRRLVNPAAMDARLPVELAEQLACNSAFRGKHNGERVVLLSSGESSARLDRNIISGRGVIAVNEMFGPVLRERLSLAAIVIQDAAYFEGSPKSSKMLSDAAVAAHEADALVVLPADVARKRDVAKMLSPERTLTFFESGRAVYDLARPAHVLDMTRVIPSLPTVSHVALVAALYLGYAEVSMLGVDLKYISYPNSPVAHAYGQNPYLGALDELTAAQAYLQKGWTWPTVLRHVASQLEAYAWLAEGAVGQGHRIINLSRDSLLSTVSAIEQAYI